MKNTTYYNGVVYEFNLPTGHSCPFAKECLVKVDRHTGRFTNGSKEYYCYASKSERFPAVRGHRWANFEAAKSGLLPELPVGAKAVRVHMSGDFFNQKYFDSWMSYAMRRQDVEFWAYTKSLIYWVERLGDIPENFVLTASYGGRSDYLIDEYDLKRVKVYQSVNDVPLGVMIDTNDDLARDKSVKEFGLLDNMKYDKKSKGERRS